MTGTKDAKQRVMQATVDLLREGGLRAAAPAAVAERAGAGKMSLYRHFGSKDELVAESLRGHFAVSKQRALGSADDADPRQRVLAIFDRLIRRSDEGVLRPCMYVTTRLEAADAQHPAASVTADYKRDVAETLASWLREMDHPEPESTGRAISMLIDGSVIHATITGDVGPILDARRAVEVLLGQ